ncbi:hypothetical protein SAMN05216374_4773 [Tardiphaga sp. OK246]|jgi:hypothetical protein|nr:hypothetical protein SAMN05216374_4773 [Tardiphaga sp. OK246]
MVIEEAPVGAEDVLQSSIDCGFENAVSGLRTSLNADFPVVTGRKSA